MNMQRCATITILGRPNAGKSTLLNTLIGQKLAAVSPKAQTTRTRLAGVLVEGDAQLVLTDTPGIFAATPKNRLEESMLEAAWESIGESDIVLLLIDASTKSPLANHEDIIKRLKHVANVYVALNKVDTVTKDRLLPLAAQLQEALSPKTIFMISATNGDGLAALRQTLSAAAPAGPWLYEGDDITNAPLYELAAECTREQLYLQLGAELPYDTTIAHEKWEAFGNGSVKIHQQIVVARDSQKAIVIGKGGSKLKSIGEAARAAIEELTGTRVHLMLHVKVIEGWQDRP
jgi:GTP-binding protein Era